MINEIVKNAETSKSYKWAWENFEDLVQKLIDRSSGRSVIEIGGGRSPTFTQEYVERNDLSYTSNDISARELSLAPDWVQTAHFDVQHPDKNEIEPFSGKYDLCFSKMVMEHVKSYKNAYRNIYTILKPGGVSIAFHPTLYALPFMMNFALPDTASRKLLTSIFPNRTDEGTPKFPAYYSGCRISKTVKEDIQAFGFSNVWQIPFYGHNYYAKFPIVRNIHSNINGLIMKNDIKSLSSFCYTIVQK